MKRHIVLIGLDGVSLGLLKRAIDLGWIPHLKHIISSSKSLALEPETVFPPYTPVAWTSILTGVNPGKHGIFGFYVVSRRDKEFSFRLATALDVEFPRVFEITSMVGLKTFVYNVPLTYPAVLNRNIVLVSGWDSPRPIVVHPGDALINRVTSHIKGVAIKLQNLAQWDKAKDLYEYMYRLSSLLSEEIALLCELLEHLEWNLSVIILSELDWIQHRIPGLLRKSFQRVYYLNRIFYSIDYLIAKVIKLADIVFMVSDHGFCEYPITISVNEVLRRVGLLKVCGNAESRRTFLRIPHYLLQQRINQSLVAGKIIKVLDRVLMRNVTHDARTVMLLEINQEINYENSCAVMFENATFSVYCNKSAREVTKQVLNILVKVGLAKEIREGNSMYVGSYSERGPDFVLIPRDSVWFTNILGKLVLQNHVDHSFRCIFIVYGDDLYFDRASTTKLSVFDIAPTILWLLGVKVHPLHDGKVIDMIKEQVDVKTRYSLDYVERYILSKKLHSLKLKFTR